MTSSDAPGTSVDRSLTPNPTSGLAKLSDAMSNLKLKAEIEDPELTYTSYVKGFAIDWRKLMKLVDVEDENDPKVHAMHLEVMKNFIDRDKHWICTASALDDPMQVEHITVVSLGEGSVSKSLEELEKKDLPIPEYLTKLTLALTGPAVFRFFSW